MGHDIVPNAVRPSRPLNWGDIFVGLSWSCYDPSPSDMVFIARCCRANVPRGLPGLSRRSVDLCHSQFCDRCPIRHKAICAALGDAELKQFSHIARRRIVSAGHAVTGEDEVLIANIVSGVVKLTKMVGDGRQQIVGLQFPPDFLARIFSSSTPLFAEAVTDVELCAFPKKDFDAMLKRYPDVEHQLFDNMLIELDAAREWMLLLGRKTAQEKVASFLLMIARRVPEIGCHHMPEPDALHFMLPLKRADIADYLGMTVETVSRQMTRLKTSGAIRIIADREIIVPDIAVLENIADP